MLLSVQHCVRYFSDLFLEAFFEDNSRKQVLLSSLHSHLYAFLHPQEGQGQVIVRVKLRSLANQRRLAKSGHHPHSKHLEGKPSAEEGWKDGKWWICYFSNKLRVLKEAWQLLSNHADSRHQCLSLSLTTLRCFLVDHFSVKSLFLRSELLSMLLLLIQLLLLHWGFQLVLILQSLTFHLLLSPNALLVGISALLPHGFLLLQLLPVSLELQLHCILSLLLFHLLVILNRLPLLLFLDLSFLDLELSIVKGKDVIVRQSHFYQVEIRLKEGKLGSFLVLKTLTLCFPGARVAWFLLSSRKCQRPILHLNCYRGTWQPSHQNETTKVKNWVHFKKANSSSLTAAAFSKPEESNP